MIYTLDRGFKGSLTKSHGCLGARYWCRATTKLTSTESKRILLFTGTECDAADKVGSVRAVLPSSAACCRQLRTKCATQHTESGDLPEPRLLSCSSARGSRSQARRRTWQQGGRAMYGSGAPCTVPCIRQAHGTSHTHSATHQTQRTHSAIHHTCRMEYPQHHDTQSHDPMGPPLPSQPTTQTVIQLL